MFHFAYNQMLYALKESLVIRPGHLLLHLSHDDLDGHGCSIVRKVYQGFATFGNGKHHSELHCPEYYRNTNQLGDRVYAVIERMLQSATAKVEHNRIVFLITDIGSITYEELEKRFSSYNNGDIHFIIIDHHQTIYSDKLLWNRNDSEYRVFGDDDGAIMLWRKDDHLFKVHMYIDNTKSATKLLYDMLFSVIALPKPVRWTTMMFAYYVSEYDMGNTGHWYIEPEYRNHRAFYEDYVSTPVKLNTMLKVMLRYTPGNSGDKVFHSAILDYIWKGEYDQEAKYKESIYRDIVWTNERYSAHLFQLKILEYDGSGSIQLDDDVIMKIPENSPIKRIGVWVYSDESTIPPIMTLYSKHLLPDNPSIDALVLVNYKLNAVDTRSYKEEINMYDICSYNGGGGHPHAAGYPIKNEGRGLTRPIIFNA